MVSNSIAGDIIFVAQDNPNPKKPYGSWDDAATRIADALGVANGGDIVVVKQATYTENLKMPLGVTLISKSAWVAWATSGITSLFDFVWTQPKGFLFPEMPVIHGSNRGSVITCKNVDTSTAIVGFQIQKGKARDGGGIYCRRAPLLLACNLMVENTATESGGAVHVEHGMGPTLICNTLRGNSASSYGGGVNAREQSMTWVVRCTFLNNEASEGGGGGIACQHGIVKCEETVFQENHVLVARADPRAVAWSMGNGGGFYARALGGNALTSFELVNCDFLDNTAKRDGGGLSAHYARAFSIVRANFRHNIASDDGGGAYFTVGCEGGFTGDEERGVFLYNEAKNNGGGIHATFHGEIQVTGYELIDNRALSANGGGASCRNLAMEFRECRIVGNSAAAYGGGIYAVTLPEDWLYAVTARRILQNAGNVDPFARLRAVSCQILENTSLSPGGGVALMNPTWPQPNPGGLDFWIQGCTMRQNWSQDRSCCVFVSHGSPILNESNVITGCSVSNNLGTGILVEKTQRTPDEAPRVEISRNGIDNNPGGILIEESAVTVYGNKILDNSQYGLLAKTSRCVVSGNWFMRNSPNQIEAGTYSTISATTNAIMGEGVSEKGIRVDGASTCTANWNNIFGHTVFGAEKLDGPVAWMHAMFCFWGDISGPYHPLWNPTGQGDEVRGNVFFFPPSPDWVPMW
jgi:predicted outer membrane repeat protein